jgi:hypothetical protein
MKATAHMNVKSTISVTGMAIFVLLMGMSSAASATTRYFHASACTPAQPWTLSQMYFSSDDQWYDASSTASYGLLCPLTIDGAVSASIKVSGWNSGPSSFTVEVCAQNVTGGTPTCGATKSTSVVGVTQFNPGLPSNFAGAYDYLFVGMSPGSTFWGYSVTF